MDSPSSFNLWTEPWIRVVTPDGAVSEIGIRACLEHAHEIHALCDPSPLVVGGTHRLLAAVLQAITQPNDVDDIEALWNAGRFDQAQLDDFERESAEYFDLFHPDYPFMQTRVRVNQRNPSDRKPVSALFTDVPTETNRTLYHHVSDDSHEICPPCCARGMISIPAFATRGGSGIRPSINDVPPVYILPAAQNLFATLVLSILAPDSQPQKANPERARNLPWGPESGVERNVQVDVPGYIESLLFPARWLRLLPIHRSGRCSHCGQQANQLVAYIWYKMGHWLNRDIGPWDDPFVAWQRTKAGKPDSGLAAVRPIAGKGLWREYSALLLSSDIERVHRPKVVHQMVSLMNRLDMTDELHVRCVWIRTDGNALFYEWGDEALEAPPGVLTRADSRAHVDDAIKRANQVEQILHLTYTRFFARRKQGKTARNETERFRSLRDRMKESFWQRAEPRFREFIRMLAEVEDASDAARSWSRAISRIADGVFVEAIVQVGSEGDALRRRVLALDDFRARLYRRCKEWDV